MRKFYLENEIGQRKSLIGGDAWFTNPEGLGILTNNAYADIGGGFYRDVSTDVLPRSPVLGNLVFTRGDEAYRKYRELTNWMLSSKQLYLVYSPYGNTEFFRGITIEYINKGELGAGKFLTVPVSFMPTTPWFLRIPTQASINFAENEEDAKRYAYHYDYKYVDSIATATAEVQATGHTPAGIVFAYKGAIKNPVLMLYGKRSGEMYGNVLINLVSNAGDTLEYSSKYDDSYIRLRQSSGSVVDLIDAVDITQNVFFRIPVGESCVFEIASEDKMSGSAQIAVFDYFRTV